MLKSLSLEQVAKNKASGEWERTLKAFENGNVSIGSRVVQELPRQAVNVTAGAAVGAGQVAVETVKAPFEIGQRIGTPIGNAIGTVAGDALYDRKALSGDIQGGASRVVQEGRAIGQLPAKEVVQGAVSIAGNVATQTGQAIVSGAGNYVGAIQRGDGYEAGRIVGRTAATTALAIDVAPGGKALTEAGVLRGSEKQLLTESKNAAETAAARQDPLARMNAGNAFDAANRAKYPVNQLYVTGGRLDSYIPGVEIVSRKSTQLAEIKFTTARGYLSELEQKYAPGTKIKDVPSTPPALVGAELRGKQVLEVPVQLKPVPAEILEDAKKRNIIIRDINGKEY